MKKLVLSIFTAGILFNVASVSDTCAMLYNYTMSSKEERFSDQYILEAHRAACEGNEDAARDALKMFGRSLITSGDELFEEVHIDMFVSYVDDIINNKLKELDPTLFLSLDIGDNDYISMERYVKGVLDKTVIDTVLSQEFKSKKLVDSSNRTIDKDAREYLFYRIMNFAASNNINLADISRTLAEYQKDRFFRGKLSRCNDITNLYLSGNLAGVITETNNRIANFFDVQPSIVEQTPGLFSRLFSGWFS